MQTLSEIVGAALRQADASVKVASLRDAPIEDRGFARVDHYLAAELGQLEPEPEVTKQASGGAIQSGAVDLDDVMFARKLAEALEHGTHIIEKLAIEGELNKSTGGKPHAGATPRGGPAPIFPHNFDNAETKTPIPQASAHARAAQANRTTEDGHPKTDEHMQLNDGPVIPNGYKAGPVRTNPGHSSKEASKKIASREEYARVLNSKIAQHKMLVSLGQTDAANAVLKEAADIAENASLIFGDNYQAAHFPDNEGIRNLTKAQARDMNQREAGQFFGEPVKRDSAVTTHLAIADGLKLSADGTSSLSKKLIRSEMSTSIAKAPILHGGNEMPHHSSATQTANPQARLLGTSPVMSNVERSEALTKNRSGQKITKVAKRGPETKGYHETMADAASNIRANAPVQAGTGAVGGGLLGGMLGHSLGKGRVGTAVGAGLGALGVGALGYHGAKGEQAMRRRLAGHKTAGVGDALLSVGRGTVGALRSGARGIGSGAKSVGKSLANTPAIGARQAPGLLERGANAVRQGAVSARQGLAGIGETGQKAIGAGVLGTAALGTAGIAGKALGGRDRR